MSTPISRINEQVEQLKIAAEVRSWDFERLCLAEIEIYKAALREIEHGRSDYPSLIARKALEAEQVQFDRHAG